MARTCEVSGDVVGEALPKEHRKAREVGSLFDLVGDSKACRGGGYCRQISEH